MAKWFQETGPESDIVVSSRVRIARNIQGFPFPHKLNEKAAQEITRSVYDSIIEGNTMQKEEFSLTAIKDLDKIERLNYIERHLISPDLAKNVNTGSILINKDRTISVLINEEDHIRIQCLLPGFQLQEAWELGNQVDDLIEEKLKYSFEEEIGYLTACPTNIGTGIRASVMLHLPALFLTRYINGVLQAASQIGLAVRGIYGEGSEFLGNLYQISNQVTLGVSEQEIIENLHGVTKQIIQKERSARENLIKSKKIELEDKVFRSLGILKNARKITSGEAMHLISDVKLGISLELVNHVKFENLNKLITQIQPGYLQKYFQKDLTENERDIKRAELIRKTLS